RHVVVENEARTGALGFDAQRDGTNVANRGDAIAVLGRTRFTITRGERAVREADNARRVDGIAGHAGGQRAGLDVVLDLALVPRAEDIECQLLDRLVGNRTVDAPLVHRSKVTEHRHVELRIEGRRLAVGEVRVPAGQLRLDLCGT